MSIVNVTKRRSSKVEDSNIPMGEVKSGEKKSNAENASDQIQMKTKNENEQKQNNAGKDEKDEEKNIVEKVEDIMEEVHCCIKVRNKFWFKVLVFCIVIGLDGADLVSDWLLFRDVFQTKEGLVYGPPDDALTYSLLAFSIVGTFTFIFEITNLWWEIFRENPWIDSDLASAITIWIEDVPQIIINVLIVVCREEAISYFQLVKASVLIFGVVIRIIVSLIRYCTKSKLAEVTKHTKESCRHVTYRAFIMIGLIVIFAGSISVFMLTQFERHDSGSISFNLPKTIFEGSFHDEKYFTNVSIFLSHPIISLSGGTSNQLDFVRLISINDVKTKKTEIFKLTYDSSKTKFAIWQTDSSGNTPLVMKECFTINRNVTTVTPTTTSCSTFPGQTAFIFKFQFEEPKIPDLLFGDIKYNVKVYENSKCHDPTSGIVESVSSHDNPGDAVIHYYKTHSDLSHDTHLVKVSSSHLRFYRNEQDLTDITEVWKTGFGSCESTGSLAPHRDTNIAVSCTV